MTTATSLTPHTNELQEISGLLTESALQGAALFLACLVEDPAFVESEIILLLQGAQGAKGWYVARRYDGEPRPATALARRPPGHVPHLQ